MTQDERAGPNKNGGGAGGGRNADGVDGAVRPGASRTGTGRISRHIATVAVICLALLTLAEALGLSSPSLRAGLILGLVGCGTAAILVDARRRCPGCGALCGYHLRIVNADKCRVCGAPFVNGKD